MGWGLAVSSVHLISKGGEQPRLPDQMWGGGGDLPRGLWGIKSEGEVSTGGKASDSKGREGFVGACASTNKTFIVSLSRKWVVEKTEEGLRPPY